DAHSAQRISPVLKLRTENQKPGTANKPVPGSKFLVRGVHMSQLSWVDLAMIAPGGSPYGTVIPGPDRVAKGQGLCYRCLPHQQRISARRTLRSCQPATESCSWGSDEHCGRASAFLGQRIPLFPGTKPEDRWSRSKPG